MPKISEDTLAAIRTEILDGARACFISYGYDGATVSRLEQYTGKSRGAIFHHFQNKETLFLAVAHEDSRRLAETAAQHGMIGMIRHLLASPSLDNWWGMRMEISRRVRTDPCFRAKWEVDQLSLKETVSGRLEENRQAGKLRTDISLETTYQLLDMIFEGVLAQVSSGAPLSEIRAALDVVENSLRLPTPPSAS